MSLSISLDILAQLAVPFSTFILTHYLDYLLLIHCLPPFLVLYYILLIYLYSILIFHIKALFLNTSVSRNQILLGFLTLSILLFSLNGNQSLSPSFLVLY